MALAAILLAAAPAAVSAAPPPEGLCLSAATSIAAGAAVGRSDFAPARCGDSSPRALRYDFASGALTAVRDIAKGETIDAPPDSLLTDIRAGDPLFLRVRVGGVVVEREVLAAQPGRHGGRIFARTADGRLVAAKVAEEEDR
jgi:flagella basal body P-ring formation protein FlgA